MEGKRSTNNKELEKQASQIARDQVSVGMWTVNIMMVFYGIFAVTLILALEGAHTLIVATVALAGLYTMWLIVRRRYSKLFKQVMSQELRYLEEASTVIAQPDIRADLPQSTTARQAAQDPPVLTVRQKEILELIAKGYSNKQIGTKLGLSEQTIKNQVRLVYRKLNVQDRTQAVLSAMSQGLIPPTTQQPTPGDTKTT